jgi:hypothetical protein
VCALSIVNPDTRFDTPIYAIHDPGSNFTLLRKSVAKEIGLVGEPILQSYKTLGSITTKRIELTKIHINGLEEDRGYALREVRIIEDMPKLNKWLPHHMDPHVRSEFKDIRYPTLEREQCDMVIGADNYNLLRPTDNGLHNRIKGGG